MADPLELLESFPRSLTGGAPDPGNLRKRGDRRRTQHRVVGATAVIAALAAVVTPLALSGGDDSSAPPVNRPNETVSPDTTVVPQDVVSLSGEIPAQFPLMTGLPSWTLAASTPIDAAKGRELVISPCGQVPGDSPERVDTLQLLAHQEATTYQRTVMTFEDHDAATAWAQEVAGGFGTCAESADDGGVVTHQTSSGSRESDPFLTVISSAELDGSPQPGVQVDQVYVVGRAVLVDQVLVDDADPAAAATLASEQAGYAAPVVAGLGHEWIGFGEDQGVFIEKASQVDTKLAAASPRFRSHIRSLVTNLEGVAGCAASAGVTVNYVVDDRWALGAVNSCGGYVALWGGSDAGWAELQGTQDVWYCPELAGLGVPEGVVGPCFTPEQ